MDNAAVPAGSPAAVITRFGQTAVLGWEPLPDATTYDVVRGPLAALHATAGNFAVVDGCLANDIGDTALVLSGTPGPATGYFYLIRGTNCGGHGAYDENGPGQVGARDAEIAASSFSCP